jgi:DTW domain-containing protein YfiP
VLVLQHPHEVHEAKGSARLLQLSLTQVQVEVGAVFDASALATWLGAPGESVLLYPDTLRAAADDADAEAAARRAAPQQLVVLDATWKKSLRLLAGHPLLQALPRLALHAPVPSVYGALRRAPKPGQLSTLEATCHALQAMESAADAEAASRYAPLLQAFSGWVAEGAQRAAHPQRVAHPPRG